MSLPRHNIEVLLDRVEWENCDTPDQLHTGDLYATMKGELNFLGFKFRCYVLNDGQRVLNADDVEKFFA